MMLFALEGQRRRIMGEAGKALASGQIRRAQTLTAGADALHAGDDTVRIQAICHLLKKEFNEALKRFREVKKA
jgi:hypothetical protein